MAFILAMVQVVLPLLQKTAFSLTTAIFRFCEQPQFTKTT